MGYKQNSELFEFAVSKPHLNDIINAAIYVELNFFFYTSLHKSKVCPKVRVWKNLRNMLLPPFHILNHTFNSTDLPTS
ncbi:hypothetical protein BH09BAC2_BH09BAC2_11870 [soil metagenome]